ncbi:LPS translocon maturation chaperone LptM [Acidihalobacter ferrooxydans]|nr:lipoprotein [Acidihalobacter ferrooxydans]
MNIRSIGRSLLTALLTSMLVLSLGGCGKKGPLYLPQDNGAKTAQQGR